VRLANDLAFSCEAARMIPQCRQNAARLRLLQRPVSRHAGICFDPRALLFRCSTAASHNKVRLVLTWLKESPLLTLMRRI
jgi:hypothetical protein